ncbi:hypothetical protein [Thermococcus sp.]|uniref:hypothetical protein n=1 Tax=Thermococcus sp. TaxID=35749 RepID=UPI002639C4A7|nr:hypothetical protein [Thermococcus sp.]
MYTTENRRGMKMMWMTAPQVRGEGEEGEDNSIPEGWIKAFADIIINECLLETFLYP